jgi:hypothetical protein
MAWLVPARFKILNHCEIIYFNCDYKLLALLKAQIKFNILNATLSIVLLAASGQLRKT